MSCYLVVEKRLNTHNFQESLLNTKPMEKFLSKGKQKSHFTIIPRLLDHHETQFSCGHWYEHEILNITQYFPSSKLRQPRTQKSSGRDYHSINFYELQDISQNDSPTSVGSLKYYPNLIELRNSIIQKELETHSNRPSHSDILRMNNDQLNLKSYLWEFKLNYLPNYCRILPCSTNEKYAYYLLQFNCQPTPTPLYYAVCQYYANMNSKARPSFQSKEEYRRIVFKPDSIKKYENKQKKANDFPTQIENIGDYTSITVQDEIMCGFSISKQTYEKLSQLTADEPDEEIQQNEPDEEIQQNEPDEEIQQNENHENDLFSLRTLTHIFYGSKQIICESINKQEYIRMQIDTSFKIFQPYVFALVIYMWGHTGFPLGYIIAPSESSEIYNTFFTNLQTFFQQEEWEKAKELFFFQSDEGSALKKFYKDNNFKHCFCHVHIVRNFGVNSKLRTLISKALRCINENEWAREQQKIGNQLQYMLDTGMIKEDKKFQKFIQMFGFEVLKNSQNQNDIIDLDEPWPDWNEEKEEEKEEDAIQLDKLRVELYSFDNVYENSIHKSKAFHKSSRQKNQNSIYTVSAHPVPDKILNTWALWKRNGMPAETNFIEGEHGNLRQNLISLKNQFVAKLVDFNDRCIDLSTKFQINYKNNFIKNLKVTLKKLTKIKIEKRESLIQHFCELFNIQYPFPEIKDVDLINLLECMDLKNGNNTFMNKFSSKISFINTFKYSQYGLTIDVDQSLFWDKYNQFQVHKLIPDAIRFPSTIKIFKKEPQWVVKTNVPFTIENYNFQYNDNSEIIINNIFSAIKALKSNNTPADILHYTLIISETFSSPSKLMEHNNNFQEYLTRIQKKYKKSQLSPWEWFIYCMIRKIIRNSSIDNLREEILKHLPQLTQNQ